jgi:hypothetical protein
MMDGRYPKAPTPEPVVEEVLDEGGLHDRKIAEYEAENSKLRGKIVELTAALKSKDGELRQMREHVTMLSECTAEQNAIIGKIEQVVSSKMVGKAGNPAAHNIMSGNLDTAGFTPGQVDEVLDDFTEGGDDSEANIVERKLSSGSGSSSQQQTLLLPLSHALLLDATLCSSRSNA